MKTNRKLKIKFNNFVSKIFAEPDSASGILSLTEKYFPISNMGKTFKGNHHLYFDRTSGKLTLSIWTNDKVGELTFNKK